MMKKSNLLIFAMVFVFGLGINIIAWRIQTFINWKYAYNSKVNERLEAIDKRLNQNESLDITQAKLLLYLNKLCEEQKSVLEPNKKYWLYTNEGGHETFICANTVEELKNKAGLSKLNKTSDESNEDFYHTILDKQD